jgi:uncharacterized protein YggT (Ycf19 family)
MTEGPGYWLYMLVNFALAAAMYTLMGRYLLSLVFKPESDMVIWRVFTQITDPILHFVRALTPVMVPGGLVMVFAIFWLILARVMWLFLALVFGFAPKLGA